MVRELGFNPYVKWLNPNEVQKAADEGLKKLSSLSES